MAEQEAVSLEGRNGVERVVGRGCVFQHGSKLVFGRLMRVSGLDYTVRSCEGKTLTLNHSAVFSATEAELVSAEKAAADVASKAADVGPKATAEKPVAPKPVAPKPVAPKPDAVIPTV